MSSCLHICIWQLSALRSISCIYNIPLGYIYIYIKGDNPLLKLLGQRLINFTAHRTCLFNKKVIKK